jgi:hypothetical protein
LHHLTQHLEILSYFRLEMKLKMTKKNLNQQKERWYHMFHK